MTETAAPEDMRLLAAKLLSSLAESTADELGSESARNMLALDHNPAYAGEWWHGTKRPVPIRTPLAEGFAEPDVDGYTAYLHRGIRRDELPGVIGFLIAVLAAQPGDEAESDDEVQP